MEVYGTEQSDRVKQRCNREFWAVLFWGFFLREALSVHVPKTFPFISPPHPISLISSASPV